MVTPLVLRSSIFPQAWNRCHGAFYQIASADLRWNLEEQDLLSYSEEICGDVPALIAKATAKGVGKGILGQGAWVSQWGEVPAGEERRFVDALEARVRELGKRRIAFGAEEFHFLPGIPFDEPAGERLVAVLRERGYVLAEVSDFVGELGSAPVAVYVSEAVERARAQGWSVRKVESLGEREELTQLLAREFKGRWEREWQFQLAREDAGRAFWSLFRDECERVMGFSRLAVRARVSPITSGWNPGALRLPLRAGKEFSGDTDSCLGPIGISSSERGRGAGRVLLGLALGELLAQGAQRACIDWTNAYNYYAPLGFPAVRRYFNAWEEL